MFQYAAAKAIASRLHTDLLLDLHGYGEVERQFGRFYLLKCFDLADKQATLQQVFKVFPLMAFGDLVRGSASCRVRRRLSSFLSRSLINIDRYLYLTTPDVLISLPFSRVCVQQKICYYETFESIPDNVYLYGFWESERFFSSIQSSIKKIFTFPSSLFSGTKWSDVIEGIEMTNSVAIHVRRGDKVNSAAFFSTDLNYIKKAMEIMENKVQDPCFFIFSDDLKWTRENLPPLTARPMFFVEGAGNQEAHIDMGLISRCKHVIVGTSTFSWWGGWLNDNPDKIIIAPNQELWHGDARDRHDLLPRDWIVL